MAITSMISSEEKNQILSRFPSYAKLSYEIISYKKVSEVYDVVLAVPFGKRVFLWFTLWHDAPCVYVLEVNLRDNDIANLTRLDWNPSFAVSLSKGTIFAAYMVEESDCIPYYIVDDVFLFKGESLDQMSFQAKMRYLREGFEDVKNTPIFCIVMKKIDEPISAGYSIRYTQYRSSTTILPILNKLQIKNEMKKTISFAFTEVPLQLHSPFYQQNMAFWVRAGKEHDVYLLFAMDSRQQPVFYQYACIPTLDISIWMNGIFRRIRENWNIDLGEESEDEEDFQNIQDDKYVFLQKQLIMTCVFHWTFKRWVPIEVVQGAWIPLRDELVLSRKKIR